MIEEIQNTCILQEEEMALTLQTMYEVTEDLPAWTAGNTRRAGLNLDGEWTRSVLSVIHTYASANAVARGIVFSGCL